MRPWRFEQDASLRLSLRKWLSVAHRNYPAAGSRYLRTPEGKKLYALDKRGPERVFGIVKLVPGFSHRLLRGRDGVRGDWSLVTMAWNMKRIFALRPAQ